MLEATVLVPTHNHGRLLTHSVRSALTQTVQRLEVWIVGDGVTDETRDVARSLLAADPRVRFHDLPKGPRLGEAYRHQLLLRANSRIVCYLSDDDLWLPDHLANMCELLNQHDFAHALPLEITPSGALNVLLADLANPLYRRILLSGVNRVGLSFAGHTLAFYRRLPHGWRTTPVGIPTDLYMWQQFLQQPDCRAISSTMPTVLNFPSPQRRQWDLADREKEMTSWANRLGRLAHDPEFLRAVSDGLYHRGLDVERHYQEAMEEIGRRTEAISRLTAARDQLASSHDELRARLDAAYRSRGWRLVNRLGGVLRRLGLRRAG